MAEKFKFTVFDKHVLEKVSAGENDLKNICAALNVDWKDFQARTRILVKKSLLMLDESDSNLARLGVEGYNALHPAEKPKRTAAKRKPKAGKTVEKIPDAQGLEQPLSSQAQESKPTEPQTQHKLAEPEARGQEPHDPDNPHNDYIDIPYNPLIHGPNGSVPEKKKETVPAAVEKPKPPAAATKPDQIDLIEIFEKYGVKKKQAIKEKLGELSKAIDDKPLSTTLATIAREGKYESEEKCDLCKAPFRLSLRKDNHPKYGHCFCGAAYHKDCYESLLDRNGKCLRCGKKLVLMLDKQSEDAVKAVKKLFE
ncbi:MAG: hypothetical protein NTY90_03030 [Candidatus Micrarchaeota archaeon]|nr:hypothetical protein [Candidatus Micrarchaeota archaeon]